MTRCILQFQDDYKQLVEEEAEVPVENYSALANSNIRFIDRLTNLLSALAKTTGFELGFLQQTLSHSLLFANFVDCSNLAFARIEDLIRDRVTAAFMAQVSAFAKMDMVSLADQTAFMDKVFMEQRLLLERSSATCCTRRTPSGCSASSRTSACSSTSSWS